MVKRAARAALCPYGTVAEMRSFLRSKGWVGSGNRSDLKERIDAVNFAEHCVVSDPSNNKRQEQCSVSDPTNKRPRVDAKPESQSEQESASLGSAQASQVASALGSENFVSPIERSENVVGSETPESPMPNSLPMPSSENRASPMQRSIHGPHPYFDEADEALAYMGACLALPQLGDCRKAEEAEEDTLSLDGGLAEELESPGAEGDALLSMEDAVAEERLSAAKAEADCIVDDQGQGVRSPDSDPSPAMGAMGMD